MAYTEEQRKEHITELQRYLYGISMFDKRIPTVLPDGIYGSRTAEAVRSFQRAYGLPVTGETDGATWNKVVEVYRSYLEAEPEAWHVFPSPDYCAKTGDHGEIVYVIQVMLKDIGDRFDNMPKTVICGDYDEKTSDAVKQFQKQVGIEPDGSVDSCTWNMLVHCCEHIDHTGLK